MKTILKDITEYIDFLRSRGICVMLSCFGDNFGDCLPVLLEYEVHRLPVCAYLKSNPVMRDRCIRNKRMLEKKKIPCTYYSHCYAGVEEYVYPIIYENKPVMCVNISGYRGQIPKSLQCAELTGKRCSSKFGQLYSKLSTDIPEEREINQVIRPLEYMVCELYRKCRRCTQNVSGQKIVFRKAITYIYENYTHKIECEDVAKATGYSQAHLRHIFKEECGVSIMEYVNDVRMSHAAEMLRNTSYGITDIAFFTGFSDSNYFSAAFRKKYGVSPKMYRKADGLLH